MTDQARNLRSATTAMSSALLPAIAVTGGKGGVGKTAIAVNLALMLARLGLRPLLVDFDLSLANADVLLGLNPTVSLHDVVMGYAPLASVAMQAPGGIGFVPAASGVDELTRLSDVQLGRLHAGLQQLSTDYDLLVIDTAAGIGREVMATLKASRITLVVVTPDPTSLADAYALIKVLERDEPGKDIRVVVNMANHQSDGLETYNRLRKVVATYLHRDVPLAVAMPRDSKVSDAVRGRRPFVGGPDSPAVLALRTLAMRMKAEPWRPPTNLSDRRASSF